MRIFVINLPHRADKRAGMLAQAEKHRLRLEIIDAVNGGDLSDAALKALAFDYPDCCLTKGVIGCALSHLKIYKKMLDENIPIALVLEDDAILHADLGGALERIVELDKNTHPQVYLFSSHYYNSRAGFPLDEKYSLHEFIDGSQGHGYALNLKAAESLCKNLLPIKWEADKWYYFQQMGLAGINCIVPHLIGVNGAAAISDLHAERSPVNKQRRKYLGKLRGVVRKRQQLKKLIWKLFKRPCSKKKLNDTNASEPCKHNQFHMRKLTWKAKKTLAKLITMVIPHGPTRKKARDFLADFSLSSIHRYCRDSGKPARPNTILIIEPNRCHGECLPGFSKYLIDMGFCVEILAHFAVEIENPCCRVTDGRLIFHGVSCHIMRLWLRKARLENYRAIIINTSAHYWSLGKDGLPVSAIDQFGLRQVKNLLVVEHDLADVNRFAEQPYASTGRLITLGAFPVGTMINPHYFGNIQFKDKNKKTRFIVVGGVHLRRKNHAQLLEAARRLVSSGIVDFEIVTVGGGSLKNIPRLARPHIAIRGHLSYPDMYDEMEKADFYLPLLDPENESHNRYLTTGVTGSAQLIYGFAKPCLIAGKFAKFYGFDEGNSIIYDNDADFPNALREAIDMPRFRYDSMREKLGQLSSNIREISKHNLRRLLDA